jgi:carboxymethylenebutenolidase
MRQALPSGTECAVGRPSSGGEPDLGLVIGPDLAGLRRIFDDLVQQVADEQGWAVVAPDALPTLIGAGLESRFKAMASASIPNQVDDVLAAADLTRCSQVGYLGFCLGGLLGYHAALTKRFYGCVSFYGPIRILPDWRDAPGQREPLEMLAGGTRIPLLAMFGEQDELSPLAEIDEFRKLPDVEVLSFPGADHAFAHDHTRPTYRPADAGRAWLRALDFLKSCR